MLDEIDQSQKEPSIQANEILRALEGIEDQLLKEHMEILVKVLRLEYYRKAQEKAYERKL